MLAMQFVTMKACLLARNADILCIAKQEGNTSVVVFAGMAPTQVVLQRTKEALDLANAETAVAKFERCVVQHLDTSYRSLVLQGLSSMRYLMFS